MEAKRRKRIGRELLALGAFEIGVEDEAFVIGMLQQDHADVGQALRIHGRQRHAFGIVRLMGLCFREPLPEKLERFVGRYKFLILERNGHLYSRSMAPLLSSASTKLES